MYAKNDKVVASPRDLGAALKTMKDQGALLVILVIRQADRSLYCEFKNIAERLIGIQSICIVERLTKPDKFFIQYMQNISMKLNLKLGGVNHTALQPNERLIDTMILGADLIHPSSGSIAAVVGSVDAAGGKCLGSVRLQPIQDADGEITDREVCVLSDSKFLVANDTRSYTPWRTWLKSVFFIMLSSTLRSCPRKSSTIVMVSALGITSRSRRLSFQLSTVPMPKFALS